MQLRYGVLERTRGEAESQRLAPSASGNGQECSSVVGRTVDMTQHLCRLQTDRLSAHGHQGSFARTTNDFNANGGLGGDVVENRRGQVDQQGFQRFAGVGSSGEVGK